MCDFLVFWPQSAFMRTLKAECSLGWAFFETSKFFSSRGSRIRWFLSCWSLLSSSRIALLLLLHSVPVFVYLGVSINPFRASLRIYKVHEPAIVMPNKNLLDIGSACVSCKNPQALIETGKNLKEIFSVKLFPHINDDLNAIKLGIFI